MLGGVGGEEIGEGREREEERDQVSHRPVHEPLDEAILGMDAELRKRPEGQLAVDFMALPQLMFLNLNSFPKFWKMIYPEVYFGADVDIHM